VLIFYRYRAELERLQAALPQARTIDERGVLEDWNAGRVPVLLAHPASAGHGLNLQAGGHTIIWSTLPWSLEEWDQSNARLARQGQDHPVIIHRLEVANTVDEAIYARLSGKADTQAAIMAALRLDK
jgi:SNF2 family DNA or RNA helicase